jgi:hypothetical protein
LGEYVTANEALHQTHKPAQLSSSKYFAGQLDGAIRTMRDTFLLVRLWIRANTVQEM